MDLKRDCRRAFLQFAVRGLAGCFGQVWPVSPGRRFIQLRLLGLPGVVWGTPVTPQMWAEFGKGASKTRQRALSYSPYHSTSSRPINNAKGILNLITALSLATNLEPLLLVVRQSRNGREEILSNSIRRVDDLSRGSYRLVAKDRHG
jgi:hypothetical protein